MLQNGLEMEQAVARKSALALHQEATHLLQGIFVWTGVQVQGPEGGCKERVKGPQGEKLFGQLLIDGRPRKLLLVIARQKEESRPRMIAVGRKGTSILFIPCTSQYSFLTWHYDDPRFHQWQPDGENPLDQLARSVLPMEHGTNSGKQKPSKKQRPREESESEDKETGRKLMNQETEASGGGGTSEDMDE